MRTTISRTPLFLRDLGQIEQEKFRQDLYQAVKDGYKMDSAKAKRITRAIDSGDDIQIGELWEFSESEVY